MIKKISLLQISLAIISIVVIMYIVVVNFSGVETTYECKGVLTENKIDSESKLFLKIDRYRWWVHLWSDDYASVFIELPSQPYEFFHNTELVGQTLHVYDNGKKPIGYFSLLSKTIMFKTAFGFYEGNCSITK